MVKITDLIIFEQWIGHQSSACCEIFANRLALRMLPFWREMSRQNDKSVHSSFHVWRLLYMEWAYFALPTENPKLALGKREAEENYRTMSPGTNYANLISSKKHEERVRILSGFLRSLIKASAEIVSSDDPAEDIWSAISFDASALDSGRSFSFVSTRPLWPSGIPGWSRAAWEQFSARMLQADLADDNAHWSIWANWYDQRVGGFKVDQELELKKALTPDPVWRKGARELNLSLLRTEELHAIKIVQDRKQLSLFALLSTKEIRAAIADFQYDQLSNLMRMVPFLEDLANLENSDAIKHRKDTLSELNDGISELFSDIALENKNVPRPFLNALERYSKEISRDLEDIRAGRLWDLGSVINAASLDDEIRYALGDLLHKSLEVLASKHLDLMRDYFASTIARQRNADSVEPNDGVTSEQVLDSLKAASRALRVSEWGSLPPPDEEIPAVVADQIEEAEALLSAAHSTSDERIKRQRLEAFWRKSKTTAVTIVRLAVASLSAVGAVASSLSAFQSLFPAPFARAVEMLVSLFKNIPWLS